jgi:hypothetical protein
VGVRRAVGVLSVRVWRAVRAGSVAVRCAVGVGSARVGWPVGEGVSVGSNVAVGVRGTVATVVSGVVVCDGDCVGVESATGVGESEPISPLDRSRPISAHPDSSNKNTTAATANRWVPPPSPPKCMNRYRTGLLIKMMPEMNLILCVSH